MVTPAFDTDFRDMLFFDRLGFQGLRIQYVCRLPLIHPEPSNYLFATQSIIERIPLITCDKQIRQYDFPHVKAQ